MSSAPCPADERAHYANCAVAAHPRATTQLLSCTNGRLRRHGVPNVPWTMVRKMLPCCCCWRPIPTYRPAPVHSRECLSTTTLALPSVARAPGAHGICKRTIRGRMRRYTLHDMAADALALLDHLKIGALPSARICRYSSVRSLQCSREPTVAMARRIPARVRPHS